MKKKESRKDLLFRDSIIGIVASYGIDFLYPPFIPITIIMRLFGFGGIGFCAFTYSKYDRLFKNCDLNIGLSYPILKNKCKTEYGSTIYKFTLPCGLSEQDFTEKQQAIENYIGKEVKISYTFKEIVIEEFEKNNKIFREYEPIGLKGNVPVLIGYNRKGELIWCDLGDGEPHLLIAGQTGGGKSTSIRAIITNLILFSDVNLHLVDLKNGVELRLFAYSSKVFHFCRTINSARVMLQQMDLEVDARYNLFYKYNVRDIVDFNKKFPENKMTYEVVIIDEFADLQSDKESIDSLDSLGRKARACGIHMIISTQRPDSKVLTGSIKANVPTILGLKTTNGVNSNIIIDEKGLENLRGKGHGLFKRNGKMEEIQVPLLSSEHATELIKHTFVDKDLSDNEGIIKKEEISSKKKKSKVVPKTL